MRSIHSGLCRAQICLSLALLAVSSIVGGCALPTGILRSRWAMDDPDYAEKYAEGAEKTDIPGKIKQASDARFVKGASGKYVSGGIAVRPDSKSELFAFDWGLPTCGYPASVGIWSPRKAAPKMTG